MQAGRETSALHVSRLRYSRSARRCGPLFQRRGLLRSAAATPVSARRRTPRTGRRSGRLRSTSHRPPENAFGGETRERLGIANELCTRFLHIALQSLLRLRDQFPCLVHRTLDEALAMSARFGAELLSQLGCIPLRFVQRLLDPVGRFVEASQRLLVNLLG